MTGRQPGVDSAVPLGHQRGMRPSDEAPAPAARPALLLASALVLAGCAGGLPWRAAAPAGSGAPADPAVAVIEAPGPDVLRPEPRPAAGAAPRAARAPAAAIQPRGRTAAALDRSTEAERAAAAEAARRAEGRALGETLASLGNPAEPGFWLATGLVDRARPGRVVTAGGQALAVELRPSGGPAGGGSQLSLPALRALGLPLTELARLQVFALD